MSKSWREFIGFEEVPSAPVEVAFFCEKRGQALPDGTPQYTTEQSHQRECDVNEIIKRYDKTGLIDHVTKFEAAYGDVSGLEFRSALELVNQASSSFMALPASVRAYFENSPEKLLTFMEDPLNRNKAIELGLINSEFPTNSDGLGEHVKMEDAVIRDKEIKGK